MINPDKNQCCGCRACEQKCPKNAITMVRTREGFLMPKVDGAACVECGLCDGVCPLSAGETEKPVAQARLFYHADAAYRMAASSSGAFEAVCRAWAGDSQFTVFGCAMNSDNRSAGHISGRSWQQLQPMKKSKYVHSDTGDSYRQVRQRLLAGDRVVFSGTPCQVMGLKNYLGRDYENLLTVDFICHGTPSPLALKQYIRSLEKKYRRKITGFTFRNKHFDEGKGWSSLGVRVTCADGTEYALPWEECSYMVWFLQGALSMECCYSCRFASCARAGDITLGDYWGIECLCPELGETKTDGVSMLLLNTDKGRALEEKLAQIQGVRWQTHDIAVAKAHNHQLAAPAGRHAWRDRVYEYLRWRDFDAAVTWLTYGTPTARLKRKLAGLLSKVRKG